MGSTTTCEITAILQAWFGTSAGISVRQMDGLCPLFPEEEEYVRSAVFKRRLEFSTGRCCAREALEQLGVTPAPILMGPLRAPIWPRGFIGTITHAEGISAAVVARTGLWQGIGIDILGVAGAREVLRVAAGIVAGEQEEQSAQRIAGTILDARVLLFSAKESVIKAISSSSRRFVDFTEIAMEVEEETFSAACPGRESPVHGWWKVAEDLLITGATLPIEYPLALKS
jgi:4'-phosphopantetheinyl transferase EntD